MNWLYNIVRSKYVRELEEQVARERAENERLRAENRALMNSLLGTAGFPPVEFPEPPKPQPLPRLRKRSWHQIQAWRESDAARDSDLAQEHIAPGSRTRPAAFSDEFGTAEQNIRGAHAPRYSNVRTNGPVSHS